MNGKAGAPPAPPEVSAFVDGMIRRLVSQGDVGWKEGVEWLAKSGDPATAFSLRKNDWYHLQRALEVIKVRINTLHHHAWTSPDPGFRLLHGKV